MVLHFSNDWRRALAVMVLFLVTGVGIIVYLNQYPMQPRERDYSYVASFFAFSLWIGIGASGLIRLAFDALSGKGEGVQKATGGVLAAVFFLAVPGLMTVVNYDDHDRSGRYIAPDFAYNMLQSMAPNAILFTNGDNDTFPLWYLQEVEGVRQDVRVVNLSLLNTPWYIKQIKNQQARDSAPVPMTLSDDDADRLQYTLWEPREVALPVRVDRTEPGASDDWIEYADSIPNQMVWRIEGRPYAKDANVIQIADQAVISILAAVAQEGWERPVYYATTVSKASELGLGEFFQNEGLVRRVVPIQTQDPYGRVVPEIVAERLGKYRFRNLDDPDVYYDENIRNMSDNYRTVFGEVAEQLAVQGNDELAQSLLNDIQTKVPFETIPADFYSLYVLANAYDALGQTEQAIAIIGQAEKIALHQFRYSSSDRGKALAVQYIEFIQGLYLRNNAFDEAAAFSQEIGTLLGQPDYGQTADELREMAERARQQRPTPDPG